MKEELSDFLKFAYKTEKIFVNLLSGKFMKSGKFI